MHKFPRWFIIFSRMPQFSDSKGQRFESPRPHQEQCFLGTALFILCEIVRDVARVDSNSLCPPLASRRAKTVLRTVFKARLGESPRPHQKRSLYCSTATFFYFVTAWCLSIHFLTLRGNIGRDRHEKTDKIAHEISFPCWFCTLGSTRAILSVFVFV